MFEGLPEKTTYAELLEFLRRDLRLDATVDILDGTILAALTPGGVSKFPQLPAAKSVYLTYGESALVWTASVLSASLTVTHGLGRVPYAVVATSATSPALVWVGTDTFTSTTFNLRGQASSSFSGTVAVSWIAVGP